MSTQTPSDQAFDTIAQQAQAVAQTDVANNEPAVQNIDLINSNESADNIAPPVYDNAYGEIDTEQGTSASVTNDGRVDIRINQLNRRFSQVFVPAFRQQVESVQDSPPPPTPYIPPSLGGDGGVLPPPCLNVVIQVVGSRGDVQPFVALGKVLKETYGHRVRLATHPTFKDFVQDNGLEFFSIGGDPSQLMAFMVKNPGLMPGFRSVLNGDVGQQKRIVTDYIQGCWQSCYQAGDGMIPFSKHAGDDSGSEPAARPFVADCIIANPPSFAHIHCAEKLGIPLHIMFTMPYSPTQAFPHPLANIQSSNADPQLTNYMSYAMIEVLSWQGLGEIINRFRSKCLGLDPVSLIWAPGMLHRLKIPHTYCWSPALIPKPKDWGSHISISGFYFLNLASNYTPTPDLQTFLEAGPPPVYIGFGSIVLEDPNAMTELIFEAVRKSGQRVLLSKGWGGMGADELSIPDGVFLLGNVPHDWLFKYVSCVVHHGGAGTTAAGITAGRPTLVVPFFGDQPFWGAMVARAGAGPDPIPHKQLTADKLAEAINFCLKPESLARAKDLASRIATERGSDMGAQSFHQYLNVEQLRCTLSPSRPAAWRVSRTQVKLSAYAACTLANAKLLDFNDLKIFRPQEYNTDEGPWDPVSGGATALFGVFSSMMMGLAPPSSMSRESESSSMRESSLKDDHTGQSPVRSRDESGSSKSLSVLRKTGVHTSKGLGRIMRTTLEAPMDVSVSLTKGFHNVPKLWGDDTVRPQERVGDFKSGAKAAGKEFGFGLYDGVTGLFTQPWIGAKKEGTSGFFRGVGKGIGGFATKPGAALLSVPAYTMKGVYKQVQKQFGSNVQSYIIASRAAQGYEEWLHGSDAEKQDIIDRWKLIQKTLKKSRNPDDKMLRDILSAQGKVKSGNGDRSADASTQGSVSSLLASSASQSPLQPANMGLREQPREMEIDRTSRLPVQETPHEDVNEASDSSVWNSDVGLNDEEEEQFEPVIRRSEKAAEEAVAAADGSLGFESPPSYDPGHLAGPTRSEFEAHQQVESRGKTMQEKTEEEIVMEYVKKQSLLEAHHQNAGKGRTTATDNTNDADIQRALELSLREHEDRFGQASGT